MSSGKEQLTARLLDFIKENKHLPGVPSAQELVDNGLDVAQTDAKLLEKIEEMSLFLEAPVRQLQRNEPYW